MDPVPAHSIVPAGEGDLLTAEQNLDDGDRLREALDPDPSAIELQPGLVVLRSHVPGAQANRQAAIGQEVGRRRLTRHQHGVAEVVVEHVGPTRSRVVAAAALISAGMGAKIPAPKRNGFIPCPPVTLPQLMR